MGEAIANLMPERKLQMDPTPPGLFVPLRKQYPSIWVAIRKQILKDRGAICQICGHIGEQPQHIECHEIYSYPSTLKVLLERVILLCWRCHAAVHFERSEALRRERSLPDIIAHYKLVNGNLSDASFQADRENLFQITKKIQDFYGGPHVSVDVDYGPYQILVEKYEAKKPSREKTIALRKFLKIDRQVAREKELLRKSSEETGSQGVLDSSFGKLEHPDLPSSRRAAGASRRPALRAMLKHRP